MILDSQDEEDFDDLRYTDYPNASISMTTNRDYSIGQFQTNTAGLSYGVLKIKDLNLTYDGTNWYRVKPIDSGNFDFGNAPSGASTQNTTIDGYFTKTSPRYDYKNNAIFLYPRASSSDVASGAQMYVEWFRTPVEFTSAELTAGTVSPGIDATFHMMLAYGAAYEYCNAKGLPQTPALKNELLEYEKRLRTQYSSKQLDRKYQLQDEYQNYK